MTGARLSTLVHPRGRRSSSCTVLEGWQVRDGIGVAGAVFGEHLVSLGETLVLSKTVVIFSLLNDDNFARPARELMPQAHFCRRNTRERPRETVPETHFEVSPFVVRAVLGEILTFVGVSLSSLCACRIL